MIRVLLFAGLAETAGASSILLDDAQQQPLTVQAVRDQLSAKYPAMKDLLEKSMAAVNQEYATSSDSIKESDEIAFIPPVSGG